MEVTNFEADGEGELEIPLNLEEDSIRNNELSSFRKAPVESIADKTYRPVEQQLLQEGKLGDSEISARIRKAIFGSYNGQPACLILLRLDFCPKNGRGWFRFRNATVQLDFEEIKKGNENEVGEEDATSDDDDDDDDDKVYNGPLVLKFYPDLIRGHIQHSAQTYGVKLKVEPAAAGVGAEIGGSKTFLNEGLHLVHGRLVGSPETSIKWIINENVATRSGIYEQPSFAVIVRYEAEKGFAMKLAMKATTYGGLAVKGKKGPRIAFKRGKNPTLTDLEKTDLEELTNMRAALLAFEGPGGGGQVSPPQAE